jgi:hydrogenase maturation factor
MSSWSRRDLRYLGVKVPTKSPPPLPTGKIPVRQLARLLARIPPAPPEVRLGPRVGEDACAIEVPPAALVVTTKPITLTARDIGRFSVIVNPMTLR